VKSSTRNRGRLVPSFEGAVVDVDRAVLLPLVFIVMLVVVVTAVTAMVLALWMLLLPLPLLLLAELLVEFSVLVAP